MSGADPKAIFIRVGLYIFFYAAIVILCTQALVWVGGDFLGLTMAGFLAAWLTNFLSMRIHERRPISEIGLRWNERSWRNLAIGMAGGVGTAAIVIVGPLAVGAARLVHDPAAVVTPASIVFVLAMLLVGSAGEEMFFRGYGFQVLFRTIGPFATIMPVGVVFAALHSGNPNSTSLALANTAGFGILFGYAFYKSRDLWLPIGLHFGWNLTLPLFGTNVSGFPIKLTAQSMEWTAGSLWSGGAYGPEGSILTTASLIALFAFLWSAPVARQDAPIAVEEPGRTTEPTRDGGFLT